MPPWHIDRSIGEYSNDPSLSDKEVATDRGVGRRRRARRPRRRCAARESLPADTEWTYGEPDLIVRMAKGFKIPAQARTSFPKSTSIRASPKIAT